MATVKDTAEGGRLTRTVAANIIAGLGTEVHSFEASCDVPDHGSVDRGRGSGERTGGAGSGSMNDGKGAGRDGRAMPLFNVFRPF